MKSDTVISGTAAIPLTFRTFRAPSIQRRKAASTAAHSVGPSPVISRCSSETQVRYGRCQNSTLSCHVRVLRLVLTIVGIGGVSIRTMTKRLQFHRVMIGAGEPLFVGAVPAENSTAIIVPT